MQELRKEALEEPEEVYMGMGRKTKTSRYEDAIEAQELDNFRRVQMTKKEKQSLRNNRTEEMQEKLDTLDDDNRAIENILRRDYSSNKSAGDDVYDAASASKSKFAKSLKKMSSKPANGSFQKKRDDKGMQKGGSFKKGGSFNDKGLGGSSEKGRGGFKGGRGGRGG